MSDDDYEVGYGKPPKHSRFGQPGGNKPNKKGRPEGSKNLKTMFLEEMDEKIIIKTSEGRETICSRRALLKRLKAMALKGDIKAILKMIDFDLQFNPENLKHDHDPNAPKTGVLLLEPPYETEEDLDRCTAGLTYKTVWEWEREQAEQQKEDKN